MEASVQANGPFVQVRRVRSFEDVVLQIREAILGGQIQVGDRLPDERTLCQTFGVSRPTLREALRSLEAIGLIEIRTGAHGGAFARQPSEHLLARALSTLLSFQGATQEELMEFRLSFESENAELAATRLSPDELAALRDLAAAVDAWTPGDSTVEALNDLDARWHETVARATHNTVRVGIMLGIQPVLRSALPLVEGELAAERESIATDMHALSAAFEDGDAPLARSIMERHVRGWSQRKIAAAATEDG
jgi:GntR family transcriptional repressor for pyruvate dehydrogenase complex